MKKRKVFSTAAAALVVVSMLSVLPMNVEAVGSSYSDTLTTADDKNTTSFDKYLVMDANANVPNATFTYTITSDSVTPISADINTGKLAVLAGVGTPTVDSAVFIAGETTYAESTATTNNDTVVFTTTDTTDEKYAKKTLTIDFSSVTFTEPGVYRYIITESGDNQGVTNDSELKRTLDVYVEDDSTDATKQLKIAGYVMYSGEISTAPSATATETEGKSSSYTNTYSTHDLTFGKEVTGNQGSKDKYFKFTVNITDAVAGTIYDVDLTNADATSGTNAATLTNNQNQTNPTSITVGSDGTVSTNFYLQHGQSIVIKGIADGTAYTITETQEDYTPTAAVTGDTIKNDNTTAVALSISDDKKSASVADDGLTADTNVAFTNNRNGVIPTGVLISIAPAAIIGLLVIGGIIFLVAKNKRREAEED